MRLTGPQLRLRPLRSEDRDTFVRIYTSPILTRYLGVDRMTPEQATAALHKQLTPGGRRHSFALTTPGDDTMHGIIGLLVEEYGSNGMITGLVMLPGSPLRGLGAAAGRLLLAYAFGPLGLHRVWAGHRHDHTHMGQIMADAGLHPEATLRELFHTHGRWHDVTTYSALAQQWLATADEVEQAIVLSRVLQPV